MARAKRARKQKPAGRSWPRSIWRWMWRGAVAFVAVSLAWVLIYKFVPPPVTFTMIGNAIDGRGITRDWMSLDRMDPDMARAAIGGEDWNFCSHHGFDFKRLDRPRRSMSR